MKKLLLIVGIGTLIFFSYQYLKIDEKETRPVQVAGAFYPSDPSELEKTILYFLENAEKANVEGPSILVVPHAGYVYSGQVAANSYKQLEGKFDTVIVIGPSHHARFDGISVFTGDYYETPLGNVTVDKEFIRYLLRSEKISYLPRAEQREHSVEVQIPFLQVILKKFSIVPILIGTQSLENINILADLISKKFEKNTLLIASSDLSHYHPYHDAVVLDSITLQLIQNLDVEGFYNGIKRGYSEACGFGPIMVAMLVAKKIGKDKVKILKYANSGDVSGDKSRVVGYAAVVMYGTPRFSLEEREELLRIARTSIESYVRDGKVPVFEVNEKLKEKGAAFVTIKKEGRLRGCIGSTTATQPLYLAVRDAAISAAVRDPRFLPLSVDELDEISLEISVLFNKKRAQVNEIEIGRHGLIIEKNGKSGLLLPQVAKENRWGVYAFLDATCEKAGLRKGCWKEAKISTFEAEVFGE